MPPGCDVTRGTPTLPRSRRLGRPARTPPPRRSWLQPAWPLWPQPPTAPGRSGDRGELEDLTPARAPTTTTVSPPAPGQQYAKMTCAGVASRLDSSVVTASQALRATSAPHATPVTPPKTPGHRAYLRTLPRPWGAGPPAGGARGQQGCQRGGDGVDDPADGRLGCSTGLGQVFVSVAGATVGGRDAQGSAVTDGRWTCACRRRRSHEPGLSIR